MYQGKSRMSDQKTGKSNNLKYLMIPSEILELDLCPRDFVVLIRLLIYCNWETGKVMVSSTRIAADHDLSRQSVSHAFQSLVRTEAMKLIKEGGGRYTNHFLIESVRALHANNPKEKSFEAKSKSSESDDYDPERKFNIDGVDMTALQLVERHLIFKNRVTIQPPS